MSILLKTFSLQEISKASEVPTQTIKTHRHKKRLIGGNAEITGGGGPGRKRGFPFVSVMQAAVAKTLIDDGIMPDRAFRSAAIFAHSGGIPAHLVSAAETTRSTKDRCPGLPFNVGKTFLLVYRGGATVVCDTGEALLNMVNLLPYEATKHPVVVVPCDPIFERVCHALGHDYRDVLSEVYGEVI